MKVALVGGGRVGRGLHRALRAAGHEPRLLRGRASRRGAIDADAILITVSDPFIAAVAAALAPRLPPRSVLLHCAGARGVDELAACASIADCGVMHPLVSFPTRAARPMLEGTTFVIDGTPRARRVASALARSLGAIPLERALHGATYHASAALVANGAAALAAVGVRLLQVLGVDRQSANRAIGALLRTVGDNVASVGLPDALTGPIARGDAATVEQHRRALARDAAALRAYDAIGPIILEVAEEAGLSPAASRTIARTFVEGTEQPWTQPSQRKSKSG